MRYLAILFLLFPLFVFGQSHQGLPKVFTHGDSLTLDSNRGAQFIAKTLRMPTYAQGDTTKVLAINSLGMVWLKTVSNSGTGTVTSIATSGGILGGTITTAGTVYADTDKLVTITRLKDSAAVFEHTSNKVQDLSSPNAVTYLSSAATNTQFSLYSTKVAVADTFTKFIRTPDTTGNTGKVLTKTSTGIDWGALSVVGSLRSSTGKILVSPTTGDVDINPDTTVNYHWIAPQDFTKITIDTLQAHTSAGGAIRANSGSAVIAWGAGGGQNITFAGYPITNTGDSVLTTNSSGGLLRYDLKGNYKRIEDSTGATGYTTIGSRDKAKDSAIAYTNTAITAERTATATLTNKRIDYRTQTVASFTTSVAINADAYDRIVDTAQSGNLLLATPTGTHFEGQEVIYTITAATGTISLTYSTVFVPSTQIPVLPAATLATTYRTIKMKFIWNNRTQKWFIVAKDTW